MTPNIKDIIRRKKGIGKDPTTLDWHALAKEIAEEVMREVATEMQADIMKETKEKVDEVVGELKKELTPEKLKGEKPEAGVDYKIPEDGKSPSREDLLSLIEEVMPEVEDGKDADEEVIVERVLESIEVPKDGKTPTEKELMRIIKPLVAKVKDEINLRLREMMREIKTSTRAVQKGGGGMGNVVPQSTAISSATTTISLASRVASNGRAIWFNYQGQQQAYGTHFTVSGNVITLLFTPEDNTYADIIYIRT